MQLKTPIILGLDVDDAKEGIKICQRLAFGLGAIKLGPRLLIQHGADLIKEVAEIAPVFVDNKYFDIPNTMESAVRQTFEAGASLCTIHALSGSGAMNRLAKLESELNQKRPFKILAVTVLTSFDETTLPTVFKKQSLENSVFELAQTTFQSGLSGLVCSPHEVKALKTKSTNVFFVTPGVRMSGEVVHGDDQSRVSTPRQALMDGSSALVIARPLLQSSDSVKLLEQILSEVP